MGLAATVVGAFALLGQVTLGVVLVAALAPLLVDAALLATRPIETRLLAPFVREAERRLTQVAPRVVAITGSFGKTSTKSYLRGLLADRFEVCPSPASFNNRAGLARAINEHLHPGAEVFIAEMGTYGRGEIRDLCEWVTPEVGVITSIGPVHLERMGTLETIVLAKREILERARVAVLNVDDPLLAALAEEVTATGMAVIRCGSRGDDLHVAVRVIERTDDRTRVAITTTDGAESASVEATAPDGGLQLTNLACAIGAARGLGATDLDLPAGIGRLHNPDHRQVVERGPSGVLVIDDSYNANPTGVQSALNRLAELDVTGRRAVVPPGMGELGARPGEENQRFAHDAGAVADVVLVVGRTDLEALLDGLDGGSAEVHWFPTREAATRWVGDQLGAGDAVLYENDLPDHYP